MSQNEIKSNLHRFCFVLTSFGQLLERLCILNKLVCHWVTRMKLIKLFKYELLLLIWISNSVYFWVKQVSICVSCKAYAQIRGNLYEKLLLKQCKIYPSWPKEQLKLKLWTFFCDEFVKKILLNEFVFYIKKYKMRGVWMSWNI